MPPQHLTWRGIESISPAMQTRPQLDITLCAPRRLRRRRPRDPDRRAGAGEVRRPGSSGTPSCTTNTWSTGCAGRARCSSRNSTKSPIPGRRCLLRPRRAQGGAGRGDGAEDVLPRRHLPARHQGACAGAAALRGGPRDRADRPCRACRGDRHDGAVAGGLDHADRDDGGRRGVPAARPGQPRLRDADDAQRRRHGGRDRRAAAAVPLDHGAAQGRHLLRDDQPAGRGEARRAACRCDDRRGLAQFVQLAAARGSRGTRRVPAGDAGGPGERDPVGRARGHPHAGRLGGGFRP